MIATGYRCLSCKATTGAGTPSAREPLLLSVAIPCPCCKFPNCGHQHDMTSALSRAHSEYYAHQDLLREAASLRERVAELSKQLEITKDI
jgi:hypothetical protein